MSVPGTVGGAVIGNAGAHGGDIAGNLACEVHRVALPRQDESRRVGEGRKRLTATELAYTYRSSVLKRQLAGAEARPVVLAAAFDLTPGEPSGNDRPRRRLPGPSAEQPARRAERRQHLPQPARRLRGRLIEAVGLKGHRIGGAQISPRHANFIVNTGEATAADVMALMNLIRHRVYREHRHRADAGDPVPGRLAAKQGALDCEFAVRQVMPNHDGIRAGVEAPCGHYLRRPLRRA